MKIAYLILALFVAAGFTSRAAYAVADDQASKDAEHVAPDKGGQKPPGKASAGEKKRSDRPSRKPVVTKPPAAANRTNSFHHNPGDPTSVAAPGLPQPGSTRPQAIVQNGTNNAQAFRSPSLNRPTAPAFRNSPHRGPNPAAVSGAVNSAHRSTGAINGTSMNRPSRSLSR
jgi:hypothetical protein